MNFIYTNKKYINLALVKEISIKRYDNNYYVIFDNIMSHSFASYDKANEWLMGVLWGA